MTVHDHPAVDVSDLGKVYPRPGGGVLRALDGIGFQVRTGEFFGFLGPNGAGKTTALEIIEGIRKPTSGTVHVLGIDPRRDPDQVKQRIGVQLQAAALVNDPEVVFLDEPTTGLDPQMRHSLWELRRLNRQEGKTIVLTTHYMEEAELLAERVAIIDAGRIRAIDTPRNLIARLEGVGHIQFATTGRVDTAELGRLAAVTAATDTRNGNQPGTLGPATYQLQVTEPKTAVGALLDWSQAHGVELRGLEVVPGTLEDVFLQLTGRKLREEQGAKS